MKDEIRSQKPGARSQKTEDRRQKTEGERETFTTIKSRCRE
jgi:hypothetical protein